MRLSKISREFKIDIQTLVEFLEKECGDPNSKWMPMSQVPEDLFDLLNKEFNIDIFKIVPQKKTSI